MPRLTAIRRRALDEMVKDAIFEATVAVLDELGVAGMTMDRVAGSAGLAKGSLYKYFPGKKALLELVFVKLIDPIFQDLKEIVSKEQSATEKLGAHLRTILEQIAIHAKVFKLLFQDDTAQGLLQPLQRSSGEVRNQLLAEVFRQRIAEGAFRSAEPALLTNIFVGLCRGVFESHLELEGREQREKVQSLIMSVLLNGIGTESGRGGGSCLGSDI